MQAAADSTARPRLPKRPPEHTLFAFVATTALFLLVSYLVLSPPTRLLRRLHRFLTRPVTLILGRVPVPSGLQTPADLVIAARSFSHYPTARQHWLARKWLAYNRSPARQRRLGDQLGWSEKLKQAEEAVELNSLVTDELAALAFEQARRQGVPIGLRSRFWRQDGRVVEVNSRSPGRTFQAATEADPTCNLMLFSLFSPADSQALRPRLESRRESGARRALPAHSRCPAKRV